MHPIHWHRYPYLFLVIPLITGIIVSPHLSGLSSSFILYAIAFAFGSLLFTVKAKSGITFCIIAYVLIFMTGLYIHRPDTPAFDPGKTYAIKGRCEQMLSPDRGIIAAHGLRIYIQSRDTFTFSTGDSVSFMARLYPLISTHNAHEFDYNKYLRHQNIQARGIPVSDIVSRGHSEDLHSYGHAIQSHLIRKLRRIVPDSTTCNLLTALCLGSRTNLPPDTQNLFQVTGTVHLLAISGLHMGAIYILLFNLLRLGRIRNKKYELTLIPLIWLITFITGASPSACRAATILTFITLGRSFQQNYIPLNAIAAAAFYSLLFQPGALYSISFQMSYAAYTGIMLIYPRVRLKLNQSYRPIRWIHAAFFISLSAQILTLPVTAYYFHTINLNSILINIIAIPLATGLLYTGLFLLILPGSISAYLSFTAISLTRLLLFCLQTFYPFAINIPDFHPTPVHLFFIYTIVGFIFIYSASRNRKTLTTICSLTGLFLLYTCTHAYQQHAKNELVIYNRYRHTTIILTCDGYYSFLKNTDTTSLLPAYIAANHLQPLPGHEGFTGKNICYTSNQLSTLRQTITIVDSLHPGIRGSHTAIITNNVYPRTDTIRFFPKLKKVILDHSNSPRCVKAWEIFCKQHEIPLFKTSELGTIVLSFE